MTESIPVSRKGIEVDMFPFIVTFVICAVSDTIDLVQYRNKTLTAIYVILMALVPVSAFLFFRNIHAESFAHSVLQLFGVGI